MFFKKLPHFFILFFAFSLDAFALTDEERATLQNNQNQQLLENQRQDIIRNNEKKEIEKIRKSRVYLEEDQPEIEGIPKGGCLTPKKLQVSGNTVYKEKFFDRKFFNSQKNKCLTKNEIYALQKQINNFYIKQGYSNARVYLNKPKLAKEKIVEFIIAEGKVEDIELRSNSTIDNSQYFSFRKKTKLFTAFPLLEGEVFNVRDFEQGLDQINRLQSNNATVESVAGKQEGYSKIIINNKMSHPTKLAVGYDNSGQKSTGIYKKRASISQDNLLGINDNLFVSYTKDNNAFDWERYSNSFYSNYTVPLGYWTFSSGYSRSRYLTMVKLAGSQVNSNGTTTINSYKADRVMSRGKSHKTKLGGGLDVKNTISYSGDLKSETGSRKLSIASVYLDNVFYLQNATFYIKPSFQKGVGWFNLKRIMIQQLNILMPKPNIGR